MTENESLSSSLAASRKQNFNLLGSQVTAVLLFLFAVFAPEAYANVPEDMKMTLGANLGGLIGFALGWWVKEHQV